MRVASRLIITAAFTFWPIFAQAANVTPEDAAKHVGETDTVCGTVASAAYVARSHRQPTFLNLDRAYPNQIFTIVIWGENRTSFGSPEITLMGKRVCATGAIRLYRGRPEIVIRSPSQLAEQ